MAWLLRAIAYVLAAFLSLIVLGAVAAAGLYLSLEPQLPSVETLRDIRLQQPLRIYTADEELIAEFGEYRREPVAYEDIPERLRDAFIAAEDENFHAHHGVDPLGMARAVLYLVQHQEIGPGGSTITMQVARNFFLSREQTYLRKLNEILLALRIERELSKEEILELYVNKIYLGQRAYGIGAAARIYYNSDVADLDLAQMAMIAGLPKAPSFANPVSRPEQALQRRAYVLRRMLETGVISQEEFAEASTAPVTATLHREERPGVSAPFVAEMARAYAVERFGQNAYIDGYRIYTTIDSHLQREADRALRDNLLAYDRRHGYRGPEAQFDLDEHADEEAWNRLLGDHRRVAHLRPALVVDVDESADLARLYLGRGAYGELDLDAVRWARPYINESAVGDRPSSVAQVLSRGDLVRVHPERIEAEDDAEERTVLRFSQVPAIDGSLISLSPASGAVVALAGGFDFGRSQFNRAVQAQRQPGSAFKPFIYSAALERGFSPASVVNDAPIVVDDDSLERSWRPENYSRRFYGPTRVREALAQSRNLVSIRVLRDLGIGYTSEFMERFGFDSKRMSPGLSLALGSAEVTPLQLTAGYAVFANGGYRVDPYLVSRIEDMDGRVVFRAVPAMACDDCAVFDPDTAEETAAEAGDNADPLSQQFRPAERVLPATNAFLITDMLKDVIRSGTGQRARELGRSDIAGKTGTTNNLRDAWFAGYNRHLVTTAWVGFDQSQNLGRGETGGRAALPMWIDFMGVALRDIPEESPPRPSGLVTARIDPESGLLTSSDNPRAIFELFQEGAVPRSETRRDRSGSGSGGTGSGGRSEPLF